MTQYNYVTIHGDSLPLIAELCGHSGEWMAIMDSAPYLWDLDWNNIQAGMSILLPDGWMIGGEVAVEEALTVAVEEAPTVKSTSSSTKTGTSSSTS